MRITYQVRDYIRKTIDKKLAPVTLEQDCKMLEQAMQDSAAVINERFEQIVKEEIQTLVDKHPELKGVKLYDRYGKLQYNISDVAIFEELKSLKADREQYLYELVDRVCIDATGCKTTEDLIALITELCS